MIASNIVDNRIVWPILHRAFLIYDRAYRKRERLCVLDHFVLFKPVVYQGKGRRFADGSRLQSGETIGVIHFNNQYLRSLRETTSSAAQRPAWLFARTLMASMASLARQWENDRRLCHIDVLTGITWFKPHGERLGFEIEPLPEGWRKRLLTLHFRLLLSALFPELAQRENRRLQPHRFWLTRTALTRALRDDDNYVATRLSQHHTPRLAG